jgi:hypothetical protein
VKEAASLGTTEAEAVRFGTAANGLINKLALLWAVTATTKVVKGGKVTAKSLSTSEAAAVSKETFVKKQTAPIELRASISKGVAEAVESNPMVKAEMTKYRGGAYDDIKMTTNPHNVERHHIPADSTTTISKGKGLAIQMERDDHRATSSCEPSTKAKEYRATLQEKIESGDMRGAVATDIWDVKAGTGRKYNKAMIEMLEVGETTGTIPPNQGKK